METRLWKICRHKTVDKVLALKMSLIYKRGLNNAMQANNLIITWLFSIPVDEGTTKGQRHGYKITSNPGTKKQKFSHQAMSVK